VQPRRQREWTIACRDSCTRFLAFSTFFGRELKAKMEVFDADKSMKIMDVSIEW